jgi:hypothetical protein
MITPSQSRGRAPQAARPDPAVTARAQSTLGAAERRSRPPDVADHRALPTRPTSAPKATGQDSFTTTRSELSQPSQSHERSRPRLPAERSLPSRPDGRFLACGLGGWSGSCRSGGRFDGCGLGGWSGSCRSGGRFDECGPDERSQPCRSDGRFRQSQPPSCPRRRASRAVLRSPVDRRPISARRDRLRQRFDADRRRPVSGAETTSTTSYCFQQCILCYRHVRMRGRSPPMR